MLVPLAMLLHTCVLLFVFFSLPFSLLYFFPSIAFLITLLFCSSSPVSQAMTEMKGTTVQTLGELRMRSKVIGVSPDAEVTPDMGRYTGLDAQKTQGRFG